MVSPKISGGIDRYWLCAGSAIFWLQTTDPSAMLSAIRKPSGVPRTRRPSASATPRLAFDRGVALSSQVFVHFSRQVEASIATVTLSTVNYKIPLYTSGLACSEPVVFER
jgi:hypothetical protein